MEGGKEGERGQGKGGWEKEFEKVRKRETDKVNRYSKRDRKEGLALQGSKAYWSHEDYAEGWELVQKISHACSNEF